MNYKNWQPRTKAPSRAGIYLVAEDRHGWYPGIARYDADARAWTTTADMKWFSVWAEIEYPEKRL